MRKALFAVIGMLAVTPAVWAQGSGQGVADIATAYRDGRMREAIDAAEQAAGRATTPGAVWAMSEILAETCINAQNAACLRRNAKLFSDAGGGEARGARRFMLLMALERYWSGDAQFMLSRDGADFSLKYADPAADPVRGAGSGLVPVLCLLRARRPRYRFKKAAAHSPKGSLIMSKTKNWLAIIAAGLMLSACTSYQEMGFTGGVSATQIDGNTFRIESRGNAFAGSSQIRDYAMMRAAEATLQSGNDYFIIATAENMSRTDISISPRTATSETNVFGNTATTQTTYSGGQVNSYEKPGQDLIIKVFKGTKPDNNPNAYNAHEVVQFLGPKVKKG